MEQGRAGDHKQVRLRAQATSRVHGDMARAGDQHPAASLGWGLTALCWAETGSWAMDVGGRPR